MTRDKGVVFIYLFIIIAINPPSFHSAQTCTIAGRVECGALW